MPDETTQLIDQYWAALAGTHSERRNELRQLVKGDSPLLSVLDLLEELNALRTAELSTHVLTSHSIRKRTPATYNEDHLRNDTIEKVDDG